MAWTSDDLVAIEKAIANSSMTVQFRDRSRTYKSTDELLRIRKLIRQELGLEVSTSSSFASRGQYTKTGKGT